jgi:hypothetical protein
VLVTFWLGGQGQRELRDYFYSVDNLHPGSVSGNEEVAPKRRRFRVGDNPTRTTELLGFALLRV